MKKTFLHLLLLMGCACCFPSCVEDKAEDAAARLTVSKVSVEVIRTGTLSTGSKATLDVLAKAVRGGKYRIVDLPLRLLST